MSTAQRPLSLPVTLVASPSQETGVGVKARFSLSSSERNPGAPQHWSCFWPSSAQLSRSARARWVTPETPLTAAEVPRLTGVRTLRLPAVPPQHRHLRRAGARVTGNVNSPGLMLKRSVAGSKDPPGMNRMASYYIADYQELAFDAYAFPVNNHGQKAEKSQAEKKSAQL